MIRTEDAEASVGSPPASHYTLPMGDYSRHTDLLPERHKEGLLRQPCLQSPNTVSWPTTMLSMNALARSLPPCQSLIASGFKQPCLETILSDTTRHHTTRDNGLAGAESRRTPKPAGTAKKKDHEHSEKRVRKCITTTFQ